VSSDPIQSASGDLAPDLFILSDLHLSAGVSPQTQRTSRLETFFYDREFANLVDRVVVNAMARRRSTVLLLNGDAFDFLAVVQVPTPEECERLGFTLTRRERKYGMESEPAKDAWKMRRIVRGHPEFMTALLRFVAGGNLVHINRGNHDVELFWPEVRAAFYEEIEALAAHAQPQLSADELRERIVFHEWFYYEPGRIWAEHGHQYEASNSFRYVLNPTIRRRSAAQPSLDLPTGSQFVRFVYNRFKLVDPYSTQVFTLEQYTDIISRSNVVELAKALLVHFPFFVRALKQARLFEVSGVAEAAVVHQRRMDALGRESGLGERLARVDRLRARPIGGTKYSLFREMMKPIVRSVLTIALLALVSIGMWMLLFSLIQNTQWLAESVLGKASLMAVLAVVTIVGLFAGGVWMARRYRRARDTLHTDLPGLAERIAETVGVPIVAFGHSHGVDRRPLAGLERFYANSGTWTIVRGPWDAVRPFGRQFTFLYVHDRTVEALRWHDAAGRWEPVTFLEDHEPTNLERLLGGDSDVGGPFG